MITDSEVVTGASVCEPYRGAIHLGLSRGRNAMAIWQDLVSEYGFASSYQSVNASCASDAERKPPKPVS